MQFIITHRSMREKKKGKEKLQIKKAIVKWHSAMKRAEAVICQKVQLLTKFRCSSD